MPMVPYCKPFGIIAREDELHGAEEPLVEFWLLVGEQFWRMPSPMETRLFFSSSTPTAMPLT